MAYGINAGNLPLVNDFVGAAHVFSKAPTYKKEHAVWSNDVRPLYNKRSTHYRIERKQVDGNEAYALWLYSTPLVTYVSNGQIIVRHHSSISSGQFFDRVRPVNMFYWRRGVAALSADDWVYYETDGDLVFEGTFNGWLCMSGAKQRVREVLDRKAAREAKKLLDPFFVWFKASQKLGVKFSYYTRSSSLRDWLRCNDINDLTKPESFEELSAYALDPGEMRATLYDHLGLRSLQDIPNTEAPRRGRHWRST